MGFGMKKMLLGVAVAGVLAMGAAARAPSVASLLSMTGNNIYHDLDRSYLVKGTGNLLPTTFQVGDSIRGMIRIDSINVTNVQTGTGGSEFAGVYDVKVTAITGSVATGFNITFGADSKFGTYAGDKVNYGTTYTTGSQSPLVAFYQQPAGTAVFGDNGGVSTNAETDILSAQQGSLALVLGLDTARVGVVNSWTTSLQPGITLDVSQAALASTSNQFGLTNLSLNRIGTGVAAGFFPAFKGVTQDLVNGPADFIGQIQLYGIGNITPTPFSNTSSGVFQSAAAVPLPTSAWMGLSTLALMGVGYASRKLRASAL